MTTKVKDIRLKPVIGQWYEYKPGKYNTDFNPGNLELSQLDEILELHYKWGLVLAEEITSLLAISAELYETKLIQQKYSEFLSNYSGQTISFTLGSEGQEVLVILDANLGFGLINRVFGGKGSSKKNSGDLTEIEEVSLKTILEPLIEKYNKVWLQVGNFLNTFEFVYPKVKIDERIRKDSEVFVLENHLVVGEQDVAKITILITPKNLENLFEQYQKQKSIQPKKITVMLSPESVKNVKVPVKVKIGTTTVTMSDIINLEPGDVFQLNEKLSDSVYFSVGEDSEFYGLLGLYNGKYAVKILEKKPKYYEIPQQETRVTVEDQSEPEVKSDEKEFSEESFTDDSSEKVDADEIEFKDDLLEEFKDEIAEEENDEENEEEDFVWDIDDLK